jgi:serine/threonine protein kinase
VDIVLRNIVLDWDDHVKLSDFGGSSINGSGPTVLPTVTSEHPLYPASTPSFKSEIFAIGSAFYELETLQAPYHDLEADDIGELFSKSIFSENDGLILGEVISKCWKIDYANSSQVLDDIRKIQEYRGFFDGGSEN